MSIRNRLLLTFILVTGLSLTLFALIADNNSKHTIRAEVENALNGMADEKLALINSYIHEIELMTASLAELPIIAQAMTYSHANFKLGPKNSVYLIKSAYFKRYLEPLKSRMDAHNLFLISASGDVVFSDIRQPDFATNLLTGPYRNSQLAMVFDKASTLLETQISNFEVYQPINTQNLSSTANTMDDADQAMTQSAFIAAPIFDRKKLIGVLAFQVNHQHYFHLATNYTGLKSSGELVFSKLDGEHVVIISPLRHKPDAALKLRFPLGAKHAIPIQKSVNGEKGSGLALSYGGTEVLAAWRYLPELNWGMVIKIDAEEAFAAGRELRSQFLFFGVVILLITCVAAILCSNHLTAPIITLVEATEKIAHGDYYQHIDVKTKDEIGHLAEVFNAMCKTVRSTMADLKLSNKALENSNKELDDFAYVASHDLKSPLRGISQLASWILEDIDDKQETQEHLKTMRSRVTRMESLLNDLLAYSRVGRIEEKIQFVDSKLMMKNNFELLAPPEDFKLELIGDFPNFATVLVAFELVFRNLISNAIKHHDKADGKIIITVDNIGKNFAFKVQDDGPGIEKRFHKKIFDLFQTLKSRDEVEGSGMGLAIIKKTCLLYGADVQVSSKPDCGACFTVFWPMKMSPSTQQ